MLISARTYAEKHGFKYSTVSKWIQKGLMTGAQKKPIGSKGISYMYLIPDDSPPPETSKAGRTRTVFGEKVVRQSSAGEAKRKRTPREISLYIRRHCASKSFHEIARVLDISTLEVRAVYDRLHKRYGI